MLAPCGSYPSLAPVTILPNEGVLMTARRNTAPVEAQTHSDLRIELDAIQSKLLGLVAHFRLADQQLYGDLAEIPEELQPAATVLHDATVALDALHSRLDLLNVRMADLFYGPGWRERLQEMSAAA